MRFILMAVSLAVLATTQAHAATCEQFVARVIEGAAYSKAPVPAFDLEGVNSYDADHRFFKITTFGDVRAMMLCNHGWVETFAIDANNNEGMCYGSSLGADCNWALRRWDDLARSHRYAR